MGRGGVLVLDFRKHQMPELLAHVAPVDVNLGEGSGLCTGEVERCAPPQREQVVWSSDKNAWRRVGSKSGDCSVVQETYPGGSGKRFRERKIAKVVKRMGVHERTDAEKVRREGEKERR